MWGIQQVGHTLVGCVLTEGEVCQLGCPSLGHAPALACPDQHTFLQGRVLAVGQLDQVQAAVQQLSLDRGSSILQRGEHATGIHVGAPEAGTEANQLPVQPGAAGEAVGGEADTGGSQLAVHVNIGPDS